MADPSNVTPERLAISRNQKELLNGHRSFTLWLTGLPAAGKSTIARHIEELLYAKGIRTIMLDGDNTRLGINKDLDFSPAGRQENIRRVAEIAKLMNEAGVIAIACFISPMAADRQMAKQIIGEDSFIEVFIDTPLDVCISRDPKGLYKRALNGEIQSFTGISAPYEPPASPDIHISTGHVQPPEAAKEVSAWIMTRKKLDI